MEGSPRAADTTEVTAFSGRARAALAALTRFFSEQEPDTASGDDHTIMSRALGILFFAGAAIGLVSLLLPQAPDARPIGVAVLCIVAIVLSGFFLRVGGDAPR